MGFEMSGDGVYEMLRATWPDLLGKSDGRRPPPPPPPASLSYKIEAMNANPDRKLVKVVVEPNVMASDSDLTYIWDDLENKTDGDLIVWFYLEGKAGKPQAVLSPDKDYPSRPQIHRPE